jgi:hypothetical protein
MEYRIMITYDIMITTYTYSVCRDQPWGVLYAYKQSMVLIKPNILYGKYIVT